ncbi:MAG: hypothetical protein GY725_04925 [bacterium]|nr:hypothetical protein [bacterium]
MNLDKYRTLFVDEATEHLGEMGRAAALLGQGAPDTDADGAIDTLFRMAHSIKGMAASMEFSDIAELSHSLEDRMEPFRSGAALDSEELQLISEVIAALEAMMGGVEEGISPDADPELLERLRAPVERKTAKRSAASNRVKKKAPRSLRHHCRVPSASAQKRWTGFWPQWVN